ncbi:NAD(P)/FAD-dependent oxidoreductase [Opitutus terrae]|uniref:FAD dependent oxidoreductase n=1 Tax=Opitutus terrae (strain DSM 11246 / JCM 15787 / PB90-1) TaxID=452637 RepID=B1ZMK6_OPITP|nr:FAD-binding oxidoreductase [Opitutus terrae]ACB74351.1 FAD dependent oxidoreductase [Opitutus terrae PB90-1]
MNEPALSPQAPGRVRDAVFWFESSTPPLLPLHGEKTAEAVVIGGGMMGLMCARTLAARGIDVALVEANTCGGEASGRSSGIITPDSELEFQDLVQHFGKERAPQLWRFADGGARLIEAAIRESGIACDFQPHDALYLASSSGAADTVREEQAARQAAGFKSTIISREALPGMLRGSGYFAGLRFSGTFGIDGHAGCAGLRRALLESGVRVFEQSRVTDISAKGAETAAGSIRAQHVFVCTDRLLPSLGLARRELYHVQTFVGITTPLDERTIAELFPAGPVMVWDTDLIYHYFRLTGDRRLLVGGGTLLTTYAAHEQHRPDWAARQLSRFLSQHFPWLRVRFEAAWPGLIGISKDFAPVIGRRGDAWNVHFAGGAAGLPWAAALGRYLAEKVLDGRDELDVLLSSERKFPIGPAVQRITGRRAAFALSHGLMKLGAG